MSRNPDVVFTAEYIKNLLYFATVRNGKVLQSTSDVHYFSTDHDLLYENYYSDFGPLNLGCVYRYCNLLNEKIKLYVNKQKIVHYTSVETKAKSNAAFLLGCFGVLYLKLTPVNALKPLVANGQTYRPFQDATQGDSLYTITILDCLFAIKKARSLEFFNFQDFYFEEYERLDKIQGGDLNWIVPGKFLAFIGPVDYSVSLYHPPEMYIDYFLENNVKIVIRLNKRMYDAQVFNNAGILHYDLFFPDGSCPPRHILLKFLQISEDSDGAIAVHCKAGLGRTGSLIGCYLIKHYRMTAREAIGWMRICRPGSVIGHQQGWLEQLEPWLIKQGNIYRKRVYQDIEKFPVHEFGVYSIAEKIKKRKPEMFKPPPPSPPPVKQKQSPENIPAKKEQLKIVFSKTPKAEQPDRRMTTVKPKLSNASRLLSGNPKISPKGSLMTSPSPPRRGNGGGEPKRPMTGMTAPRPLAQKISSTLPQKQDTAQPTANRTIPTFRTTQGPMIKTLSDAKDYLIRSSIHNQNREKNLMSSLTVTPFKTTGAVYKAEKQSPEYYNFGPAYRGGPMTAQRRRPLGRSPSPSPPSSPSRFSRGTNPVPGKDSIKEALSVLKSAMAQCREGSIGAHSVGVASLGAARDAPQAPRPPSVRSDERSIATQGDKLNSIKFQRRFRNSMTAGNPTFDKHRVVTGPIGGLGTKYKSSVFARERDAHEKNANGADKSRLPSSSQKFVGKVDDSRWMSGKLNSGWRPTPAMVHSTSRDYRPSSRPVSPLGLSPSPSRPASPRRARPPFF